jgi:hypothetical protein
MMGLSSVPITINGQASTTKRKQLPHHQTLCGVSQLEGFRFAAAREGGDRREGDSLDPRIPTFARSIQRLHVEDVDALHLPQYLETFETGCLLEVGGNGAGQGSGGEQILFGLDLWCWVLVSFSPSLVYVSLSLVYIHIHIHRTVHRVCKQGKAEQGKQAKLSYGHSIADPESHCG